MLTLNKVQIFSIIFTLIFFSYFVNYNFAFTAVLAIGFHEAGHLWAVNKLGYKTGGLYIWPVGGLALYNGELKSYNHKVIIALMGPCWGALLATVTILLGYHTHSHLVLSIGFWMTMMNSFNMLPLGFLDGGQVLESYAYSINKKFGIVTVVISTVLALVFFLKFSPALAFILLLFSVEAIKRRINDWNVPGLPCSRLSLKQSMLNLLFILFIVAVLAFNFIAVLHVMSYAKASHTLFGG
jgi:Zn-dependent protease